ncbi:trehalose-phosphatase [Pseudoclavibacter sp. 13-3]|uniref:trehalose-phosphatase n=1 Tax=Pseudoclavibacter sp. 13-3 TaxID=2901228 RepID=UPI001E5F7D35|nr:trehalose-phosphatase [Pseudoclavibacter sp. 13-3]MCD7100696.1 trehalose-phosphatase [Pseudoclavibacter sp. 13-3]
MTTPTAPFGLLLDVDGPIASPVTRTLHLPEIAQRLVWLADHDVPIAFNTGRSTDFVSEQIVPELADAGLRDSARPLVVIGEKGAVWARIGPAGLRDLRVDETMRVPEPVIDFGRSAAAGEFAATMFFDDTKRTMLSVEMIAGSDHGAFLRQRDALVRQLAALCDRLGAHDLRIDPTVISCDVEVERSGKALGAERALQMLGDDGPLPDRWFTVGDSRSDYAMADWLYAQGYQPTHVDVQPGDPQTTGARPDGTLEKPYPVLLIADPAHPQRILTDDDAGAALLGRCVESCTV